MPKLVMGIVSVILVACASAQRAGHHIAAVNMTVTLDQVSNERSKAAGVKIGDVDHLRVVYDEQAIDPRTHHVALLNFQHFAAGQYTPAKPDPIVMPLNDAWLDVGSRPYRLHLRAAVVHGDAIVIEADETTARLTIRPQGHPDLIIVAGPYAIGSMVIHGHEAEAAGTP